MIWQPWYRAFGIPAWFRVLRLSAWFLVFLLGVAFADPVGQKPRPASDSTRSVVVSLSPKQEVENLLGYLQKSGCRFQRNGTWYSSEQAADHLRKKLAYFVKKGLFTSVEGFIDKGATSSSMSGKPYLVQCADSAAVPSGIWLREKWTLSRKSNAVPVDTVGRAILE